MDSRRRLRENITLLRTLTSTPEAATEHALPSQTLSTRSLSFEREKEIVENLAFLSSTKYDPLKVMAACVDEDAAHGMLTVRLAVNTGDLKDVQQGFNKLATVLEHAALRVNSKSEDTNRLLRQVVNLDYTRILQRLRSKHIKLKRKQARKPALLTQLANAIHDKSIIPTRVVTASELGDIRRRTEQLEILFLDFEQGIKNHTKSFFVEEALMKIVEQAHQLVSVTRLSNALEMYDTINAELKTSLPEKTGKIGRYYSASYELVCAARTRKWQIFKRIKIEVCRIGDASGAPTPIPGPPPLTETLQKVTRGTHQRQVNLGESIAVHLGQPLPSIERTFQDFWYTGTRVHAEIQLLLYYELHPDLPRPRVICSSKSACYLCDLFIRFHGLYYIPRTHGRLYEKWTLPDLANGLTESCRAALNTVLDQLNAVLEQKIRSTLSEKKRVCYHPNESVLVPPGHWSNSEPSVALVPSSVASTPTIHVKQSGHADHMEESVSPALPSPTKRPNSGTSSVTTIHSSPRTVLGTETISEAASVSIIQATSQDAHQAFEDPRQPVATSSPEPVAPNLCSSNITKPLSPDGPRYLDDTSTHTASPPSLFQGQIPSHNEAPPDDKPQWQELPDASRSPLDFSIGKIHLTLSRECSITGTSHNNSVPDNCRYPTLVQVKRSKHGHSHHSRFEKASSNTVNLADLAPGKDVVVKQEGKELLRELYLKYEQDVMLIGFQFAGL
ncbi:MAG: hypothetical protein M1812_004616 [Candelaria pacifica]|nr:MAG: hypothetical protein M1812_004616 [Candelaria pacifica]